MSGLWFEQSEADQSELDEIQERDDIIQDLVTLSVSTIAGPHPELAGEALLKQIGQLRGFDNLNLVLLVADLVTFVAATVIEKDENLRAVAAERGFFDE